MDDRAVEAISMERAERTPFGPFGTEHEVVDKQLRASTEQIKQRLLSFVRVENVFLVNRHPWQLLPAARHLVAATGELFLCLEQVQARREPLLAGSDLVQSCPTSCCLMCRRCDGSPRDHFEYLPIRRRARYFEINVRLSSSALLRPQHDLARFEQ
jgi:hypothetical protein